MPPCLSALMNATLLVRDWEGFRAEIFYFAPMTGASTQVSVSWGLVNRTCYLAPQASSICTLSWLLDLPCSAAFACSLSAASLVLLQGVEMCFKCEEPLIPLFCFPPFLPFLFPLPFPPTHQSRSATSFSPSSSAPTLPSSPHLLPLLRLDLPTHVGLELPIVAVRSGDERRSGGVVQELCLLCADLLPCFLGVSAPVP